MNEEVVEKYRKKGRIVNFLSKISLFQAIMGVILLLVIVSISKGGIDQRYSYVIYGGFIIVIAVLYFRTSSAKKILPRDVIVERAQQELDLMVRTGQFPFDSKVFVSPACQTKYENDLINETSGPTVYAVGFYELVRGTQFRRDYVMFLNPYDGHIVGINEARLGYTGNETKDVKIVPVGVIPGSFKMSEFGGQPKV